MSDSLPPRPGQVTLAGWLVVLGSLATLVGAYERIRTLHSIDTRESVRRMLSDPPLAGSGIQVGTVLDVLHVLALVTAACAVAAVILGWQVLRRDKHARLALTIVAVPLLLAGLADRGFYSTVAAVAVVLLWVPQSRDWFDGVERTSAPPPPAGPPAPEGQRPAAGQSPTTYAAPSRPVQQPGPFGPPGQPAAWPPGPGTAAPRPVPGRRPTAVVWAAVLTWVFCALTTALMIGSALLVASDPAPMLDEMIQREPSLADQGLTEHLLVVLMWVIAIFVIGCCLAASACAVLLWRRVSGGRIGLIVFVVAAVAATLVMTLSSAPFVLGLAGSVTTLALLLRPEVRTWVASR